MSKFVTLKNYFVPTLFCRDATPLSVLRRPLSPKKLFSEPEQLLFCCKRGVAKEGRSIFSRFSHSSVAIPPTIYRAPKPGFPKTAAETAAEIAGEIRGAGGSAGGTAVETGGGTAVSLLLRARAVPPAVSAKVPPALPPHPKFPRQFPQQSPSSFGESGLGAL